MTEPIDQATKDLIEKGAIKYAQKVGDYTKDFHDGINAKYAYIDGATVWAGKLKQKEEAIKEKDTWISEERRISTELGNKLNELEEKLRQLETQSHDQVMIIEHLEEKLKQERNKAIDECIEVVKSGRWYPATLKELESLKTP